MKAKTTTKEIYQEVEVRKTQIVKDGEIVYNFDVLKVLRPAVKLTPETVEVLNTGIREHESNSIFSMYIKEGQKISPIKHKLK